MANNPQLHPIIQANFAKLEEITQESQQSTNQTPHPKIQRVAHYLRGRENFTEHYSPKLVSIGPIHHRDTKLKLGEEYKLKWAAEYLKGSQKDTLYQSIADDIKDLKKLFTEDAIEGVDDHELSWMLFVDGCSLLQIIDKGELDKPKEINVNLVQLVLVLQDVLLLENQLPYEVLKRLSRHENESESEPLESMANKPELLKSMDEFLQRNRLSPLDKQEQKSTSTSVTKEKNQQAEHKVDIQPPAHLLDHLRSAILDDSHPKKPDNTDQKQQDAKDKEAESKNQRNSAQ